MLKTLVKSDINNKNTHTTIYIYIIMIIYIYTQLCLPPLETSCVYLSIASERKSKGVRDGTPPHVLETCKTAQLHTQPSSTLTTLYTRKLSRQPAKFQDFVGKIDHNHHQLYLCNQRNNILTTRTPMRPFRTSYTP